MSSARIGNKVGGMTHDEAPPGDQHQHDIKTTGQRNGEKKNDLTARQHYVDHRPPYPDSMWRSWMDYHAGPLDTVLDIGSGAGNAAHSLLGHVLESGGPPVRHMILSDPYCDKIEDASAIVGDGSAFPGTRFSYRIRRGEDPWEEGDAAVDLVMACASLHWTEYQTTMANAARVLRAGGTFAAVVYSPFPDVVGNEQADRLLVELVHQNAQGLNKTGFLAQNPKWMRLAQQLADGMGAVPLAESHWENVRLYKINCRQAWRPAVLHDAWFSGGQPDGGDLGQKAGTVMGTTDQFEFIDGDSAWCMEDVTIDWIAEFLVSLQYGFTRESLAASATWEQLRGIVKHAGGKMTLSWGVQMVLARRKS